MVNTANDWVLCELKHKLLPARRGLWWQAHPMETWCLPFSSLRQIGMGFLCFCHPPEGFHPLFIPFPFIGKHVWISVHSSQDQHRAPPLPSYTHIYTHSLSPKEKTEKIEASGERRSLMKSSLPKTAEELYGQFEWEPHTVLSWLFLQEQHQHCFIFNSAPQQWRTSSTLGPTLTLQGTTDFLCVPVGDVP